MRKLVFFALMALLLVLSACDNKDKPKTNVSGNRPTVMPLPVTDPIFPIDIPEGEDFDRAKLIYDANCARCHGIEGEGEDEDLVTHAAPPQNENGHSFEHTDQGMYTVIWNGSIVTGSKMPPFSENLTKEEIALVIGYLKHWWLPAQVQSQRNLTIQLLTPTAIPPTPEG